MTSLRLIAGLFTLVLCSTAYGQTAPPLAPSTQPAKAPVDSFDPSKNVLDTVIAQEKYQNLAREYEAKLRETEMRRIKELGEQKERYDLNLATILRANLDASTLLLATQLKDVKQDFNERMAKQEQFRFESTGKTSGTNNLWSVLAVGISLFIGVLGIASTIFVSLRRSHDIATRNGNGAA